jgi:tRNA pseudouridine-54 N-methylase
MEIRNQVFEVSKAFFVPQETLEAMVSLLRLGKNLVSLQMSGGQIY